MIRITNASTTESGAELNAIMGKCANTCSNFGSLPWTDHASYKLVRVCYTSMESSFMHGLDQLHEGDWESVLSALQSSLHERGRRAY